MEKVIMKLSLKGISEEYKTNQGNLIALKNISLDFEEGKVYAIVGPSGSGKSTVIKIMAGILKPSKGKFLIDDLNLYSLNVDERCKYRNSNIGLILQDYGLIESDSVWFNLQLPFMFKDSFARRMKNKNISYYAKRLHIEDLLDKRVDSLSGGEKQRVAITRSLALEPNIILADEPTSSLDKSNRNDVVCLLLEEAKKGKICIIVTHDESVAAECDEIIRLEDGRVKQPTL
jgi:putative ABC transport system ATP-binding protein